jgi:integrase
VDPSTLEGITNRNYIAYLTRRKAENGRTGAPLSPATLNGDIRYLNAAFAAALAPDAYHRDRLGLVEDPTWQPPRMRLQREMRRRPTCVTQDAFGRALDACKFATIPAHPDCPASHWWQTFFLLSYITGIRSGAMLEIPRPSEEDLALRILRVPAEDDKSDGERAFFLTDEAIWAVRRLPISRDGKLFSWTKCRRYFYTILHRFQSRAGIPPNDHALPHALRRTKGTELVKLGCPLPLVQRELGHSSPQVTARYYIGEISEQQRTAVAALPVPETMRRMASGKSQEDQLCLFE